MPFYETIKKYYQDCRSKYNIADDNKFFSCHTLLTIRDKKHDFIFELRTSEIVKENNKKLILPVGLRVDKQRIYLNDSQIINTILKMEDEEINWFLEHFSLLLNGKGEPLYLTVLDKEYLYRGLSIYQKEKNLHLFTDSVIGYNYFSALVSFIFFRDSLRAKNGMNGDFNKEKLCYYLNTINSMHN